MLPRILLDTHVAIRWLIDSKKLSKAQLRAVESAVRRAEPLALSAVSLLEIAILVGERRLRLNCPLDEFLAAMRDNPAFCILPLTYEVAAQAGNFSLLRDPADRAIAATAQVHRLHLATSDQRIVDSRLVPVIE